MLSEDRKLRSISLQQNTLVPPQSHSRYKYKQRLAEEQKKAKKKAKRRPKVDPDTLSAKELKLIEIEEERKTIF